jgi:hypothetical protein
MRLPIQAAPVLRNRNSQHRSKQMPSGIRPQQMLNTISRMFSSEPGSCQCKRLKGTVNNQTVFTYLVSNSNCSRNRRAQCFIGENGAPGCDCVQPNEQEGDGGFLVRPTSNGIFEILDTL